MAHRGQMEFIGLVARLMPDYFRGCRVFEVGSLDINGSVRSAFRDCEYLGIDVGPGPGVDLVCQGQDYAGPAGEFDTVISSECMEHNPYWHETFTNMVRVCRPGGLVLMTCATQGRREHGTARCTPRDSPHTVAEGWSYYRNLTENDFMSVFPLDSWFTAYGFWTNSAFRDLYFVGVIRGASGGRVNEGSGLTVGPQIDQWLRVSNRKPLWLLRRAVNWLLGERMIPFQVVLGRVGQMLGSKSRQRAK